MLDQGVETLSAQVVEFQTRAEDENLLIRDLPAENKLAWNKLTDETIIDRFASFCHAGAEDDGLEWPARDVWSDAYKLACRMRDAGVPVPFNIVPNGEGGVAFEWRKGTNLMEVEMGSDRSLEFRHFRNAKLVFRDRLTLT